MIVKVEIVENRARITSPPDDKPRLVMEVPASRVRPRFVEPGSGPFVGYFLAGEVVTKNLVTGDEYKLDVIELGDRLIAPPKEAW